MERTQVTLADGRQLDVVEVGDPDGPVVVLMHGTPTGPLEALGAEAAAAELGVRVLAAARPGYAESTPVDQPGLGRVAADLLDLADQWRIERFAILGVSGGGPFAIALAVAAGQRAVRLGSLAGVGPYELWDHDDPEDAVAREAIASVAGGDLERAAALLEADVAPFIEGVRTAPPSPMPNAIAAAIVDGARNGLCGYVRDVLSQVLPWDVDPSEVRVETRLVYGEADHNVPASHGSWYAARIRGSTLEIIPGADHPATIGPSYPTMLAFLVGD